MKTFLAKLSTALIMLLCCAAFAQAQTRPKIYKPFPGENYVMRAMSDNGTYVISQNAGNQEIDNPQPAGGSIINLTDMQMVNIPAPNGMAGVNDVADNGIVVGSLDGIPAWWNLLNGEWTSLRLPKPTGTDCGGLLAVTPDAKYAVGYLGKTTDVLYAEPLFVNLETNEVIQLTNLPEVDLNGENNNQNVFFGISPDGRFILGQMSQSYMMPVGMMTYIYDVQEGTWTPVGYNYDPATKKYAPLVADLHMILDQSFSPNGLWVTGTAYMVGKGGELEGGYEHRSPYRYSVAAKQFEVYDEASDHDIAGNRITNDGVVLGATPTGNPYPTAMIRSGKFFISLDQVLKQVYNMNLYSQIGDNVTGSFECLSDDGLKAVMITNDNCYIIEMNEPFAQAASKVDLLSNYTVSVPTLSTISKIGELKLTFDREIQCKNLPSSVQLLKKDGTVVRNATSTVVSAANSHQITVTFRTQTLEPDETYIVKIPAEYIWLKDDPSIKSKEISLTYYGRGNEAVKPVTIVPKDGSVLSELNYTSSFITITFDSEVKVSPNAQCALYNDDTNTFLANMMCNAVDDKAYFFTDGAYMLYLGSNYRVEIAEGSITDMSGAGGNEAITLKYKGSYVRQLTDDDKYLFNSNCDNYEYFIFWSNETNTPNAVAQSWGFTAENSWILVRDSEDATDQALCAHSMFTPAGTSDDWLVIPQTYIPDDKATLSFDAQSYKKNKQDRLKVYVYECDMVYNYLTTAITEDIVKNGDCVFDEVLSPGAEEEILAGDWTRYHIDLKKYADKNIYVAFVNNNFDQSAIFIDNVQIVRALDFVLTNTTPTVTVSVKETAVSGIINPGVSNIEYTGVKLTLTDAEGNVIDTIEDADAKVNAQNPYQFKFGKALPLAIGEIVNYFIEVSLGDKSTTLKYSVKNLAFKTAKRVVLEEYSGKTCGNCPLGILAVENLQSLYPDNFIPLVIRTYGGDDLGKYVTGYSQFLGLDDFGAPSGRINRGDIISPMVQVDGSYQFFGRGKYDSNGVEYYTWADAVSDELSTAAELSVDLSVAYDEATRQITVPVTVSSTLNVQQHTIYLMSVVVEDNLLVLKQSNYFSTTTDPNLGAWGVGGAYASTSVNFVLNDVAKYVINGNSYNGVPMTVSDFVAGEEYQETYTAVLPEGALKNPANCHVVVMAIDGNTHKVLNANLCRFGEAGISAPAVSKPAITIGSGVVNVSGEGALEVTLYSPSGMVLGNATSTGCASVSSNGYKGMAILKVSTKSGSFTQKIVIK